MKERIVVDNRIYLNEEDFIEVEDMITDNLTTAKYTKEQVPENFSDLQELCEKINSKKFVVDCGYTTRIIITEINFGRTITFYDNGLVIVSPDKDYEIILTENRTIQQMWQVIKNLIGEE